MSKNAILTILVLSMSTMFIACSKVKFKDVPSKTCANAIEDFGANACNPTPDGYNTYNYTITTGDVDILFVDDNSGSMYVEQQKMATMFPNFLSSINALNYQIGIITTDVSYTIFNPGTASQIPNTTPRAANGFGAFQDGKLLKFPHGKTILKKSDGAVSVVQNYFEQTIKRPESQACDAGGSCPSSDERGIFALNLLLDRGDGQFFRPGAHLAIVILSDEDERSNSGTIAGYPLENYDLPDTFVSKIAARLGTTKTVSVHTIIIKPGDTACHSTQNNQGPGISGFYGYYYAQLSQPSASLKTKGNIVDGVTGSICASDYGAQLGDIGTKIGTNSKIVQLACMPVAGSLSVTATPLPPSPISTSVDSQKRLTLSNIPAGTSVDITYKCPRSS